MNTEAKKDVMEKISSLEEKVTLLSNMTEEAINNLDIKFEEVVKELSDKANSILVNANDVFNTLKDHISDITSSSQNATDILETLVKTRDDVSTIADELVKTRNKILNDDDGKMSIYNDILDSQKSITEVYTNVENLRKSIFGYEKKNPEVITQADYNRLSADEREISNGKYYKINYESIPGIIQKLDETISSYKNFLEDDQCRVKHREADIDKKFDELYGRIENLLPGATAAGLTAAYENAKKDAHTQAIIWTILFGISLLAIGALGAFLVHKGFISGDNLSYEQAIIQVMRILGLEFPFVWFAWAANIKVAQYTHLYEQYRHKWTITKTFEGMRKALEETENANADNNTGYFYKSLLTNFSSNPSVIFDKSYKPDGPASLLATVGELFSKKLKKDDGNTK